MSDSGGDGGSDSASAGGPLVVRCRGLPWSATQEEIQDFFDGCTIKNGLDGVHLTLNREGRPSGEAYVVLESKDDLDEALKKDRKHMGKRYVEVFEAKASELDWVVRRSQNRSSGGGQGGYGGGGSQSGGYGGGYGDQGGGSGSQDLGDETVIRLRGLPFECTKDDIKKFFQGLEITTYGILMPLDPQGRSSGEAYIQFASREYAERALEKNKETMGHRYIEVFRSSMNEASRANMNSMHHGGGNMAGGSGGSRGGGYGRRPGPYDRMGGGGGPGGPSFGRGYGSFGPGGGGGGYGRGPRPMRAYDGGYDDYARGGGGNGDYGGNSNMGMGGYGGGNHGGRGGGFGSMSGNMGGNIGGNMGMMMGNDGGAGGGGNIGSASGGNHVVRMRGLPFRVTENDIAEWFSSVVDPVDIRIKFNQQGRPTGEAEVLFHSDADAHKAMTKDRQNMQHRYVELFYNGNGSGSGGGGGGYGSGNY